MKSPMTDKSRFFHSVRESRLFNGRLSTEQVEGMEAILDAMAGQPISHIAYVLATAYHETGGDITPNVESLNYSVQGLIDTFGRHRISRADAQRLGRKPGEGRLSVERQRQIGNIIYGGKWGLDNLGNTQPNDGWLYRGRGMDHCTGRRNYAAVGAALGVPLLTNPDLLLDTKTAARAIVSGMQTGRYTGRSLSQILPAARPAGLAEFRRARTIINALDKADLIAGYAIIFQEAL
jgi:putative chitinase